MSKSSPADGRLSLSLILAFAATSLPLSATGIAVAVYLPQYFATELGVALPVVAAAFSLIRLIDMPLDPVLGVAMDRTNTRFGRYRVWTLIGTPVLMLAIYMLFMPPEGVTRTYIMGWLLVMYLGTSMMALSHSAWAATLATNYNERARIFGVMAAVGVAGAVLVLAMPSVVKALGYDPDLHGVPGMGWFIIILTPLATLLVCTRTPERIVRDHGVHRFKFSEYRALLSRPTVLRILFGDLCLSLGPGWMSAAYMFFFRDSRGFSSEQATGLLAIYVLAGFVGAPLMARLAMKISKHRAVMVATTGYSLLLVLLVVIPKGQMLLAAPFMFLAGMLAAGFAVLTRAMTADAADELRLDQGKERSGILFALTTLTSKLAGAFSIVLVFNVLDKVGYQPGKPNTPEAIHGLELAYLIGPIVFVMIGGLCFVGYKLGAARHAEIRRELEERDALYDEAPIVESVTGEAPVTSTR
ncbi:MAG TPA: MFS transporter [Phenylobacterium sp.]